MPIPSLLLVFSVRLHDVMKQVEERQSQEHPQILRSLPACLGHCYCSSILLNPTLATQLEQLATHHHHIQMVIKIICQDATPKLAVSTISKQSDHEGFPSWTSVVTTIDISRLQDLQDWWGMTAEICLGTACSQLWENPIETQSTLKYYLEVGGYKQI